ncbi:MAG: ACP phosphodiesterase [Flavobacteriales bacterium]
MNYLAHMVVGAWAGLDDQGVLGNFMGDAVKGRDVEGMWGLEVGRGIRLHRAIDDVSDRHEASRAARAVLRATCGKWSGVVWDVLVDHVLAAEFEGLATGCGDLKSFATGQEAVLARQREAMPERSRRFFDAMVAHEWLAGYREPATVEAVLVAMSRRREVAGPVARGWEAFLKDEESLREMGCALVQGMETWGKAQNLVSLAEQHR